MSTQQLSFLPRTLYDRFFFAASTQRKNEELQREIDELTQENQDCCLKLQDEREMVQRLNNIIEEYDMAVCREVSKCVCSWQK